MTKRLDYRAMTIEDLQVAHSEMCALAHDAKVTVSEELTVDFETQEAGVNICRQLRNLLDDNNVEIPVAEGAEQEQDAAAPKSKKKSKAKKKAEAKPSRLAPQEAGHNAAQQEKENTMTTKTKKSAKKAKAPKATKAKTAKKATAKRTKGGTGKTAKVIAMLRNGGCTRAQILKATGWKAVSVQQLAKSAGVKLKVSDERPFRYSVAK
jgi:cytoskeletal protein RodZ